MTQQLQNAVEVGLRTRFDLLSKTWREETALLSSSHAIASHPAYLEVIGLGMPVVPLILEEMSRTGGHWFEALKAITGEDPVPREHWGRIALMRQDWLDWGRRHGLHGA